MRNIFARMMAVFSAMFFSVGVAFAEAGVTAAEVTGLVSDYKPIMVAVGLAMLGLILVLVLFRLIRGLF